MKIRGIVAAALVAAAAAMTACSASTAGVPTVPGSGTTVPVTSRTAGTERPSEPPHVPPVEVVDGSELLALETQTAGPQGWRGANRFVENGSWQEYLKSLAGYDGEPHPIAAEVPAVPQGKVLVAGVVSIGCDKPGGAILANDGSSYRLIGTDLPDEPTPECYAPFITVAVVSAPTASVPAGRVGPGKLVHFSPIDTAEPYRAGAIDLTAGDAALVAIVGKDVELPDLPVLAAGQRRYAFVLTACRAEAAALEVDDRTISARIDPPEPDPVECVVARPFLAVFDVNDTVVPADARPTS